MKNQTVLIVVLTCALLASGVGLVYTHHVNRQLFIELRKLQVEQDNLAIEWESLQLEQSSLVTDAVVEDVARKRLNMLTPDPSEMLYVTPHE